MDRERSAIQGAGHVMPPTVKLALLILAFVAFVLAAFSVAVPRVNLIALGLAAWILTQLVP